MKEYIISEITSKNDSFACAAKDIAERTYIQEVKL